MGFQHKMGIAFALVGAAGMLEAADARACGACFAPPTDDTVVSGHRMVLATSKTQTTLYDQITYTGAPASFAWVLPIRGQVEFGLAGQLLFQTLDSQTRHQVTAPPYTCPEPPPGCNISYASGEGDFGGANGGAGGAPSAADAGVTVTSQQTVGSYDMVTLHPTTTADTAALLQWLADNNYAVPAEMNPIIAAYVAEGFDFLALKLTPGATVSTMSPVRVTTAGGSAALPLRMVAGGTGSTVPITLWVVGEGAYETKNFPTFRVDSSKLVWDWATYSSNYDTLRGAGYASTQGRGWLDETSVAFSRYAFESSLQQYVGMGNHDYDVDGHGQSGASPQENIASELDVLFAGMAATATRVTRLRAELPHEELAADLEIGAAADQSEVPVTEQAKTALHQPPCPDYSWCSSSPVPGGSGFVSGFDVQPGGGKPSSGCAVPRDASGHAGEGLGAAALAGLALLVSRARRRSR